MTNGATASVVNEADSRIYYKTFDGEFKKYLVEGEESDSIYLADKPNLALKSELFSGSYEDLTNKPEIFEPTTTGDGTKFLSDNGAYLAAGGADYEITYYNATATTTFSFNKSAHYFPNATSDETDCAFTFTIEDGAITNGGFSFVLKATGTNSNTFTLTDETSKGINWASDIPAELEYGKWYILAVENFTGIFCELK